MAGLLAMLPGASLAAKTDSCPSDSWTIGAGATLLGMDRVGDRQIDPEGFYCFKVVPGAAHDDVVVVGPRIVLTED
jgi:hypothetical protein